MKDHCDYCHGLLGEGAEKCAGCGAPAGPREPADYRDCPHCKRRLLALGSPACNYCGKALPENYVRAREAIRQRIGEAEAGGMGEEELEALSREGDDALSRALKSLFRLNDLTRRG